MAWTFFCPSDRMTLTADTKEQLTDKVQQHLKSAHNQEVSRTEAMDMVDKGAKQSAA